MLSKSIIPEPHAEYIKVGPGPMQYVRHSSQLPSMLVTQRINYLIKEEPTSSILCQCKGRIKSVKGTKPKEVCIVLPIFTSGRSGHFVVRRSTSTLHNRNPRLRSILKFSPPPPPNSRFGIMSTSGDKIHIFL